MHISTLSMTFHVLACAVLALWAVQSTIDKSGTKGLFLAGLALSALGFGLPVAL
jgi:hypothetical protein